MTYPDEQISHYEEHFAKEIEKIARIDGSSTLVFQQVLYVTLIDAVAKSAYPRQTNRVRFVGTVKRFGRWKDGSRVSLPHLVQLLHRTPEPAFEKLRIWAFEELREWKDSWESIPISRDPEVDAVEKLWPSSKQYRTPLQGVDLEALQHFHLLYAYRNTLVHELRKPGYGREDLGTQEPFYHELTSYTYSFDDPLESVELVYPTAFFKGLATSILKNVVSYFRENRLNPFDYYRFGSYWLEELNE